MQVWLGLSLCLTLSVEEMQSGFRQAAVWEGSRPSADRPQTDPRAVGYFCPGGTRAPEALEIMC